MNEILRLIPTLQSVNLISNNFNFLKKKKKKIVRQGIENLFAIEMIEAESGLIK